MAIHRRPLSFRIRLTLEWTLAFGVVLALASITIFVTTRRSMLSDFDRQVRTLAATELASASDLDAGMHLHEFPLDALRHGEYADKFAQIYDDRGTLLLTRSLTRVDVRLPPPMLAAAFSDQPPIVPVSVHGRPARVAALGTTYDGRRYVVAVGQFTDSVTSHLRGLAWQLFGVWLVGLMLTAAIGFVLASRALQPIAAITARAAAIAKGDIDRRLDPPIADDEIGRMTRLLNDMLERLHAVIDANRRFAADASHELRGPLTAIAGEIDVALKRGRTVEEYQETLRTLRERLEEMTELSENLMLLARAQEHPGAGVVREVPLEPLVLESLRRFANLAAERNIQLETEALSGLITYTDPRMFARVIDNLVANAIQYNRDAGSIGVRGGYEAPSGTGWATGFVTVLVRDTGPGIPPDAWERVFERFYRLDLSRSRRTGGSGLGLSICRAIVTLFGGTVRITASSPEGTTVEVRLPGARAERPTSSRAQASNVVA